MRCASALQCGRPRKREGIALESYDDLYRGDALYWGEEPNDLVRRACAALTSETGRPARAIDLGCGEGRDLIYLARSGFDATGVDRSAPGLARAERWAEREGLAVRTVAADINSYVLDGLYDLVYASGTLTFLARALRAEFIQHCKDHTRPGGVHAFNAFVEKPYLAVPPDWGEDEEFFRSGEVLSLYWDWEIVEAGEVEFDCASGGVPHRHAMDTVIARRPVG